MKYIYQVLTIAAMLALACCNESGRNYGNNLNEERNEAAAESNTEKFEGRKQKDADFVFAAMAGLYGEIKLAELANQRSRTASVKQIAIDMQRHQSACLNELKILAQGKTISVPVEETDVAKRKLEDIAGESGKEFDKEWCQEMMDLHDKSIVQFEKRLDDTEDTELKAFIDKTLPVLKQNREHLQACNDKLIRTRS